MRRFAILDARPHLRGCAYHLAVCNGMRDNNSFRCWLLLSTQKNLVRASRRNVRTAMETILILPSRTDGRRGGSTPRPRRDARQPAAPAGRLAQRLRGVVVDERSDCPAQTSALSDTAMSWFARARLTSRVDVPGVRSSPALCLSQDRLRGYPRLCEHGWRGVFRTAERPIR